MATETLYPDSDSALGFTPVNALTNLEAALNQDDTKWNASSVDATRDLFGVRPLSWDSRVVNSVSQSFRARSSAGAPTMRGLIKLGANTTLGGTKTLNTTWTTYTDAALAKPGGGTWTVQNINDLLGGYETITCGGNEVRVSYYKWDVDVTYTQAYPVDPDGRRKVEGVVVPPPEPARFIVSIVLLADPPVGPAGDVGYLDAFTDHCISLPMRLPGIDKDLFITISRASVANRPTP